MKAKLLDTINRIYETQMCKLELNSLGAENVVYDLENLEFDFSLDKEKIKHLKNRTSWLTSVDSEETWMTKIVEVNSKVLRKYADIWFSHFAYPFKARLRPPIARSLINIVNPEPKGVILDSFCGSGTTLVESSLLGLGSVGIDINPFFNFLAQAQTKFYTRKLFEDQFVDKFFKKISKNPDKYKDSLKAGTIHPLMFVMYSYATCMHFPDPEAAFNKKYSEMSILQNEWFKFNNPKNNQALGEAIVINGRAEKLKYPDNYFDGIVTSPPYSNALDYTKENRGAPEFFPITDDLKRQYEPVKKPDLYFEMMSKSIAEMVRVLKPKRKIGFVVGNQRRKNEVVDIVGWCKKEFEKNNCKMLNDITQLISSVTTWNILVDHILIFEKSK